MPLLFDRIVLRTTRLIVFGVLFLFTFTGCAPKPVPFDGQKAFGYAEKQLEFGPRLPGSEESHEALAFMESTLKAFGWNTELQPFDFNGITATNLMAKKGSGDCWVVFGAHSDTREFADQDPLPANRNMPVPGANDGASGTSVLLELSSSLPSRPKCQIWLVFFDAEDQGRINNSPWIAGSTYFVENLEGKPDAVIIVDMIGDANLNVYKEKTSTTELVDQIWTTAAALGFEQYIIPEYKYSIIDDHSPFLNKGIPAADLIDFDYPYWHTVNDTIDKISPESLQIIGDLLLSWLYNNYPVK